MNFQKRGKKIAVVKSLVKGVKDKELYADFNPTDERLLKEYKCSENEYIQQVPMPNNESKRNILYICGASGSGKSYYATQYLKEYKKCFKNPIYFFSSIQNDFGKGITNLKKVKLDENFIKTEISMEDLKDSCLIYDDVDVIRNKFLRNKLDNIADKVMQVGRHYNVSLIYTNHLPYDGKNTKMILNECHSITFFPNTLGGKARKYLLENYLGLDNYEIKKMRKLPSRWITIIKGNPMVALYEKGAILLNQLED